MWIVAIDRGFYPDVESFDNEEEALANYNFKCQDEFNEDETIYLAEVKDYKIKEK